MLFLKGGDLRNREGKDKASTSEFWSRSFLRKSGIAAELFSPLSLFSRDYVCLWCLQEELSDILLPVGPVNHNRPCLQATKQMWKVDRLSALPPGQILLTRNDVSTVGIRSSLFTFQSRKSVVTHPCIPYLPARENTYTLAPHKALLKLLQVSDEMMQIKILWKRWRK